MDNRASAWSVTINNPTPEDYEAIALARQRGWNVEGQVEKGESGTTHLQLAVRTPQVRFSAVRKAFPRAHIEPARNVTALRRYVGKEESRVAALPTGSDRYPSLSKLWELIALHLNQNKRDWTFDDKDAFHGESSDEKRARLYNDRDDSRIAADPLKFLDAIAEELIAEGYYVETHVANPAVRSAFRKWWRAILFRAMETVRQTDSVQIPTNQISTVEHNNADDNSPPSPAPGILEGVNLPFDQSQEGSEESGSPDSEGDCDNC